MTRHTICPTVARLDDRALPDITPLAALTSPVPLFAVGADTGGGPHVRVFAADGREAFGFYAFEADFTGGTRVATADFTGDGFEDVAVGAGLGGGPRVVVWDGRTGRQLQNLFTFEEGQRGGVFIAAGDATGDGKFDLIVGAGPGGGPRLKVYENGTFNVARDFFAGDPNLRGGIYVAAGDLDDDGSPELIAGTGRFNPAFINVFDAATLERVGEFEGYGESDAADLDPAGRAAADAFLNGTDDRDVVEGIYFASVADVDGDGDNDLPTGRVIGDPEVIVFDDEDGGVDDDFRPFKDDEGAFVFGRPAGDDDDNDDDENDAAVGGRATGDEDFQGVRPAAKDMNGDGTAELILGSGGGGSRVLVLDGESGDALFRFDAFPGFLGGVTVG